MPLCLHVKWSLPAVHVIRAYEGIMNESQWCLCHFSWSIKFVYYSNSYPIKEVCGTKWHLCWSGWLVMAQELFYLVTWNWVFTLVIAVMGTIGPVLLRITPLGDWLPGAQGAHIMADACGCKQLPAVAIKWQHESGESALKLKVTATKTKQKKDWQVRTAESSVRTVGLSLWVTHFISIIYCMHYYSNRKLIKVHIND